MLVFLTIMGLVISATIYICFVLLVVGWVQDRTLYTYLDWAFASITGVALLALPLAVFAGYQS